MVQALRSRAGVPLVVVLFAGAAACVPPPALTEPGCQADAVIRNLQAPVAVRFADDGRVLLSERAGRILTHDSVHDASATVVATLWSFSPRCGTRGACESRTTPASASSSFHSLPTVP